MKLGHAVLAYIAFAVALLFPLPAYGAQPYEVVQHAVALTVETDASVHVVVHDKVVFDGPNEGIVQYVHQPGKNESVKINSVRVASVDSEGDLSSEWRKFALVDSDPKTQGSVPGDSASRETRREGVHPWYSYSISDGMMRSYFPAEIGTTYLVETDYTVMNRTRVFRDVGELYWRYAHSDSTVDLKDVSLQVVLPVSVDDVVEPGVNVLAWGHGPSDGTFRIGEDGVLSYEVDCVPAGHYAECHVVFPVSWLANVPGSSPRFRTEARKAAAMAEEEGWLDANARASIWDNEVRILFGLVIAALVAVAFACVAAFGESPRARLALTRVSAMLGIVAVAEHLFFREPTTTAMLVAAAAVVALAAFFLPSDRVAADGQDAESRESGDAGKDGNENA